MYIYIYIYIYTYIHTYAPELEAGFLPRRHFNNWDQVRMNAPEISTCYIMLCCIILYYIIDIHVYIYIYIYMCIYIYMYTHLFMKDVSPSPQGQNGERLLSPWAPQSSRGEDDQDRDLQRFAAAFHVAFHCIHKHAC